MFVSVLISVLNAFSGFLFRSLSRESMCIFGSWETVAGRSAAQRQITSCLFVF